MSLNIQINRALIAVDAYLKAHYKGLAKETAAHKTILIVFQQIFGDAVVIQDSLQEYLKIFPVHEGYTIKLLARPSVVAFMEATMAIPDDMEVYPIDFKRFLESYLYYREVIYAFRKAADTLIVPGTSLSAEIFSAASSARRKIGLVRSKDVRKPCAMAFFAKNAYTEKIRPDKEDMMLQRHRLLLNYLGHVEYKAKLPRLLSKDKVIHEDHYCVMCPGSSKMEKCWPTKRFALVADYICENYGMNIHLCGGVDEVEFERIILANVKHHEKIVSHIGKTNFSDWSAIVQHSDLVIGNDSATMHLAAASRRKSICIAGVYDKYQFFPYQVDQLDKGDYLPITLIKDMPCEWCRTEKYDAGYGNEECKKRIQAGLCACCIDLITVQDVIEKIEVLMR